MKKLLFLHTEFSTAGHYICISLQKHVQINEKAEKRSECLTILLFKGLSCIKTV